MRGGDDRSPFGWMRVAFAASWRESRGGERKAGPLRQVADRAAIRSRPVDIIIRFTISQQIGDFELRGSPAQQLCLPPLPVVDRQIR